MIADEKIAVEKEGPSLYRVGNRIIEFSASLSCALCLQLW